jgi:uncharacterized protein
MGDFIMTILKDIWTAAMEGDVAAIGQALAEGQPIDGFQDSWAPVTALHLAIGADQLDAARYLVERGAAFMPDGFGRWPSTIAALCGTSEAMNDYIDEEEARYERGMGERKRAAAGRLIVPHP